MARYRNPQGTILWGTGLPAQQPAPAIAPPPPRPTRRPRETMQLDVSTGAQTRGSPLGTPAAAPANAVAPLPTTAPGGGPGAVASATQPQQSASTPLLEAAPALSAAPAPDTGYAGLEQDAAMYQMLAGGMPAPIPESQPVLGYTGTDGAEKRRRRETGWDAGALRDLR